MLQLHHTEVTETNFFLWLCHFIHILNVPVNHFDPQEYVIVATVNLNPSYFTESLNPPLAVWANLSSLFKHFISQAPKRRSGPAVPDQRHFLFLWKAAGLMFTGKHLYKWVKKGLQVVKEMAVIQAFPQLHFSRWVTPVALLLLVTVLHLGGAGCCGMSWASCANGGSRASLSTWIKHLETILL